MSDQIGYQVDLTPAQLKVGDSFVVRIRAHRGSSLAQVEATPAVRLADREPGAPTT